MEKKRFVVATVFAVLAVFGMVLAGCEVPAGSGSLPINPSVVDKTTLNTAVSAAKAAKAGVKVATEAANVPSGTYWVTQEAMDTLNAAITTAEAVSQKAGATETEVTSAVTALNSAVATFNGAKTLGSGEGTVADTTDLTTAISAAETAKSGVAVNTDAANVPTGTDWVTQEVMTALESAITVAEGVVQSASATQDDVTNAKTTLDSAVSTFNSAKQAGTKTVVGGSNGEGEQLEPTSMDGFAFNSTVNGKTVVAMLDDDAVKLTTGEELTAFFEVIKDNVNQTVTVKDGKDKAKVTLHTSGTVDGSETAADLVVAEVDMEDLLFDGTDEYGKAVRSFDLLVEEAGKAAVTVAVNLELTLPETASIYQKKDDKWTRVAAELTQADINKYKVTGTPASTKNTYGASTLGNPGVVDNLQKAFAWVNVRAEAGTGSSLEAGTIQGYSEYRILIKKNEQIGRVILTFNEKDYVSLELYGAGIPGNAERHITLNHDEYKTQADILLAVAPLSDHSWKGLITLHKANDYKFHTLVLGKNITLDGRKETSSGFVPFVLTEVNGAIDYTLSYRHLLYISYNKTLIMKPHSKITNFKTNKANSVVMIKGGNSKDKKATFYMQGGTICDNQINIDTASIKQGIVYSEGYSSIVYTDGILTGNTTGDMSSSGTSWNRIGIETSGYFKNFDE
jgi:hypothetical protein